MAYYLGIDGGGTKTTCALGDEHNLLVTVESGPSNITRVGEDRVRESLQSCLREASRAAGISPRSIARVCAGISGAGREEIARVVGKILGEVTGGEVVVTGDMSIALGAAFGEGPGVIVIAGTGSIAYGRDVHGRTARAGGWGYAISDEGSAHWIGRRAVQQGMRSMDETGSIPRLLAEITRIHECCFDQLIGLANSNLDFAALFPLLLELAESGDTIAQNVLRSAGIELARLALVAISRLFPEERVEIPLAMAGGVFRHAAPVRETFYNEVRQSTPNVSLKPEVVDPVVGALEMARRGR